MPTCVNIVLDRCHILAKLSIKRSACTGIVLWEMFTLGKTPYPGIEPGERFYDMLVKGYRQVSQSRP
jgi:hypothetical protein